MARAEMARAWSVDVNLQTESHVKHDLHTDRNMGSVNEYNHTQVSMQCADLLSQSTLFL